MSESGEVSLKVQPHEDPGMLDLRDVQEMTGLSMVYIRRRLSEGKWTKHKSPADGKVYVERAEVLEYLKWREQRDAQRVKKEAEAQKKRERPATEEDLEIII
jgi:hypothetical protein